MAPATASATFLDSLCMFDNVVLSSGQESGYFLCKEGFDIKLQKSEGLLVVTSCTASRRMQS